MSDDTAATRRRRHPDEIAPRPAPLHMVSMASVDEFLADMDVPLSIGKGHFPARAVQRITGFPWVHTAGTKRVNGVWMICESVPPAVRIRPLAEMVAENSGGIDVFRLKPNYLGGPGFRNLGLCDLDAAWAWAVKAEGVGYSYRDLWLVWRRRYRDAVARGECSPFAFLSLNEFCRECGATVPLTMPGFSGQQWNWDAGSIAARIPDPIPNSDLPDGCKRDCSCLWGAALRVNGLVPPIMEYDGDVVPGDFSVAPRFLYICTLYDPKATTPRA
jgi:hypothetical protein